MRRSLNLYKNVQGVYIFIIKKKKREGGELSYEEENGEQCGGKTVSNRLAVLVFERRNNTRTKGWIRTSVYVCVRVYTCASKVEQDDGGEWWYELERVVGRWKRFIKHFIVRCNKLLEKWYALLKREEEF